MWDENDRKSSTRQFPRFVPIACFEAKSLKVPNIFFNLQEKREKILKWFRKPNSHKKFANFYFSLVMRNGDEFLSLQETPR